MNAKIVLSDKIWVLNFCEKMSKKEYLQRNNCKIWGSVNICRNLTNWNKFNKTKNADLIITVHLCNELTYVKNVAHKENLRNCNFSFSMFYICWQILRKFCPIPNWSLWSGANMNYGILGSKFHIYSWNRYLPQGAGNTTTMSWAHKEVFIYIYVYVYHQNLCIFMYVYHQHTRKSYVYIKKYTYTA